MKRARKRSRARALWLVILATLFGVALVLFPIKPARTAPNKNASAAPTAVAGAPGKGPKKGHKPGATEDPVQADADGGPDASVSVVPAAAASASAAPGEEKPEAKGEEPSIPLGKGLPVAVNVAVFFLEVTAFDDTKGEFECTVDLRLRWTDSRLAFPAGKTLRGYHESLGKAAEDKLGKMWSPTVDVKNRIEGSSAGYVGRRLRVFPDGTVETTTRTTARYKASVHTESYPFDRQRLPLELIVREATIDEVLLRFDNDDVEFSRVSGDAMLDGWQLGLVDLSAGTIAGWNGDRYATATGTLFVDREAASSIAPVFIPLLASLLIPLLALWMNKSSEEGFEVDAFELANMGIGGLFSVIALSFAIYSANPIIAGSDNTVTRLFGLNYAMLALSLMVVIVFFRYELPRRWFNAHVQHEAFKFISWALPVLSLSMTIAFLLIAAA